MWLPDTNVWIALINPRPSLVKQRFESRTPDRIFLCDVVQAELKNLMGRVEGRRKPVLYSTPRSLDPLARGYEVRPKSMELHRKAARSILS